MYAAPNYLLREGFEVELVDPVEPGSPEQCSYGNSGVISSSTFVPNATPGMIREIPGWLRDPDGPLSIRPRYFPEGLAVAPALPRQAAAKIAPAILPPHSIQSRALPMSVMRRSSRMPVARTSYRRAVCSSFMKIRRGRTRAVSASTSVANTGFRWRF